MGNREEKEEFILDTVSVHPHFFSRWTGGWRRDS